MRPHAHEAEIKIGGTTCTFETGRIARQASGSVVAKSGDTVILATVVGAEQSRPDAAFFPLTVEYREKLAAAGRIPGSYNRREGRISDHEILVCRLIDRTVRSLFAPDYMAEVQVQVTVLSADPAFDTTSLALLAACAALHVSPIPWAGPAAGLRVTRSGDSLRAFPSQINRAESDLDFVVSSGPKGLVMVEGEAAEISESECAAALEQALLWLGRVHSTFDELAEATQTTKWEVAEPRVLPTVPAEIEAQLRTTLGESTHKSGRRQAVAGIRTEYCDTLPRAEDRDAHTAAFEALRHRIVREQILDGKRPDGRNPREIRPIWSEVGWLPRTHGSSIFTRGETQALVSCTLGTPDDAQRLEDLGGRREERFLLHYNFPPYSVGETRPLRGPGRREIGHGNLARRGLLPLVPDKDEFPYTIRVESEISESNGSSSMATVCGGSLALFHAGVPMTRAVAGIAMGMVAEGGRSVVLSDIVGEEDHLGDMDFKVVGTTQGITALQLDNKIGGLGTEDLVAALDQARLGRDHILAQMATTMAEPAREMPPSAPRVSRIAIMPDSVGILVGPRGTTIKEIQADSGARISVDDHGTVLIYAAEQASATKAVRSVQQLVGIVQADHYYRGVISGVKDFGVFVKINEVNEGLVPRDQLADGRVERPSDSFHDGDATTVKVIGVDDRGKLKLSIREAIGVDEARVDY